MGSIFSKQNMEKPKPKKDKVPVASAPAQGGSVSRHKAWADAHADRSYSTPPQWLLDGLDAPPQTGGYDMHKDVSGACPTAPKMQCPTQTTSAAQKLCDEDPKCTFFTFTGASGAHPGSTAFPMPNCALLCHSVPAKSNWMQKMWGKGDAAKYKGWATGIKIGSMQKQFPKNAVPTYASQAPTPTPPLFKPGTKVANFMPVNPNAINNIMKSDATVHSLFKSEAVDVGAVKPAAATKKTATGHAKSIAAGTIAAGASAAGAGAAGAVFDRVQSQHSKSDLRGQTVATSAASG
jgi:hypothetical protein